MSCLLEVLKSPEHWIKGEYKRRRFPATDPSHCSFCILGAVRECTGSECDIEPQNMELARPVARAIEKLFPRHVVTYRGEIDSCATVVAFNDDKVTTYDDVVRVLTEAETLKETV